MRSKVMPSMGQGCKLVWETAFRHKVGEPGKCQCHPDLFIKRCMGCGEQFHSVAPHTKTCSDRCRKRLSRMRHDRMFQMVLTYANGQ
jgi:predicted nucleic acid-binding Zn ribbon protein